VSGLATAVFLAARGIPSVVLEQRPSPGGRSSSFRDTTTGTILDNGQHILIAGYHHTMRFLNTIGTTHLLSVQPRPSLSLHHPERGLCHFSVPRWKSPAHLVGAVAGSSLLRIGDRGKLLMAAKSLTADQPESGLWTITQWLDRHRQSGDARRSFWHPLAVSIMNELPERAAARPFLRSIREAFLGHWSNACIAIPRVGLTELYAEHACRFVRDHGGTVHLGADVREVLHDGSRVSGVRLRGGREFRASAVVLAVPPYRLADLAPADSGIETTRVSNFSHSPIVSTHLWFGRHFMDSAFLGLIDATTQWVFNRTRIEQEMGGDMHLTTVTSAAYKTVDRPNEEIIDGALTDLRRVFGTAVEKPSHAVVVREKRATISLVPEVDLRRPPQKTAIPNLFLAGDWTHTGYPATIESAVISGVRCAEMIACIPAH
jgi:squalene-associated FAD-dependent desaturase